MPKFYNTNLNVYEAALKRIEDIIFNFDDFYISFSGGKDSGVLVNLVIEVAKKLNKLPVKVVFSDLETVYKATIDYVDYIMKMPEVDPYWLCFDEIDENASSIYERYYRMWDSNNKDKWIRKMPQYDYVINNNNCPKELKKYLDLNSIDKWSIENIGEYFCDIYNLKNIANFIGIRADESYGRYMAVKTQKNRNKYNNYTYLTKNDAKRTWTSLPLYDWLFADIWHYYAENNIKYNKIYDLYLKLGIKESQMRTCYAFGEEQKKSLWMWAQLEPDSWNKLVKRVEGANFGAKYNHTNINRGKIKKPENISWKEYLDLLMSDLPKDIYDNFKEKFDITFKYHKLMYEIKENISPDIYIQDSRSDEKEAIKKYNLSSKYFITYEDLCNAIIKRDFVFKKYGFGYSNKMTKRIKELQTKYNKL